MLFTRTLTAIEAVGQLRYSGFEHATEKASLRSDP